ncbi:hypothetical protein [Nocardioides humi]|nr:hypothetical protein [Nocardioides humi]
MDDLATWLAAELDEDPAACAAAIRYKRRRAEDAGRPWRNPVAMVKTIPLDEWRSLVGRSRPAAKRATLMQCQDRDPHVRHRWEDSRNLYHCQGIEDDQLAAAGT